MKGKVEDPFSAHQELKDFDFYAADGHYQKAACFDPKPKKEGESQIATGHFFRLNLRHDHLDYLDLRWNWLDARFSNINGRGFGISFRRSRHE